jgi:hypothetical protein
LLRNISALPLRIEAYFLAQACIHDVFVQGRFIG